MINETNQLSEREREILQLVATGLSNQQIANHLGISVNTVKVHLRNVFGKTGVASRAEATIYAVRSGIVVIDKPDVSATEQGDLPHVPEPVATPSSDPTHPLPLGDDDPEIKKPASVDKSPAENAPVADQIDTVIEPEPYIVPSQSPPVVTTVQPQLPVPITDVTPRRLPQHRTLLMVVAVLIVLSVAVVSAQALGMFDRIGFGTAADEANITADASRWRALTSADTPRAAFAIANLDDYIYAIGGENQTGILASVQRYDVQTNTWTALTDKPTPVTDVRAVVVGGRIYVPGGRTSAEDNAVTDAFERYDPSTDTWESLPTLPAPRSAYALAALEGTLYLFGGWDGSAYRHEVFSYDPDRELWEERSAMPTARGFMDAGVIDGGIYVVGGRNDTGTLTTNEVYTPTREGAQPWSRRAPLLDARSEFSMAVASTIIHVIGGDTGDATPLKYNARTDSWEQFSMPPQPVGSQPGVVLVDETVVTVGGKIAEAQYIADTQSYQAIFTIFNPVEK